MAADISALSDEELLASLPPRDPTPASPAAFPGSGATANGRPTGSPAAPAGRNERPDLSAFSDSDLLASLPPRQPAPEERSGLEQFARGVGIGARGLISGVADIPALVTDNLIARPINAGLDAVMGAGNGWRAQPLVQAAGGLMDAAGLPQAENGSERIMQDVNRGAGGAVGMLATGGATTATAAGPVARAVGGLLSAAPTLQVASGIAGGAASGVTREAGGGAVAQGVAGLAGSLAPSALPFAAQAGVRAAIRGGEAGRQTMADNIATFQNAAGINPTLGQATQSRGIQGLETGLSNLVGGAGVMTRQGEAQAQALAKRVADVSDALAPNASGADAGEAITRGVNAFKDHMKVTQQKLYGRLDAHLPPSTPVGLSNTQRALADLNAGVPGAPSISQFFKNSRISAIDSALVDDLARNGNVGTLPYEAIKKLRTLVGSEIADQTLLSDVPRSKWTALYGALSEDLGTTAKAAGPQAEQAWARANQFTRLGMERLEQLSSIVNRDAPEKIFRAATSGLADGGTQIGRLMKAMPVENRREVAAAVLQRLGRARPGQQNELGEAFSSESFLSNLAAMSAPARSALFNTSGFPGLEQRVLEMGRMAALRRDGAKVFANPSGTARQAGLLAWAAALGTALATGNVGHIALALAAPVGVNAGARMVTSPAVLQFAAGQTAISGAAVPAAIAAGARTSSGDPRGFGVGVRRGPFSAALNAAPVLGISGIEAGRNIAQPARLAGFGLGR